MASIDEIFGGNTLKAEDIKGKNPVVTIADVVIKEFDDEKKGKVRKPVVSFKGTQKVLICNLINANTIAGLADNRDTDSWAGTRIKLTVEKVAFGAKVVDGIRVKDPGAKVETKAPVESTFDGDDNIPF